MNAQVLERAIPKTDIFKTEVITPEVIQNVIERIATYLDPEKIILFGSRAREDNRPDSDLDVLVVMKTDASRFQRAKIISKLIFPRLFPTDFRVYTPEEFEEAASHPDYFFNPFIKEVLQDGKILYERKTS